MSSEMKEVPNNDLPGGMIFFLLAIMISFGLSYYTSNHRPEMTPTPEVVSGELTYWEDDNGEIARVMRFNGEKIQTMSAPQSNQVKTGLTVHDVSFPSCGTISFTQFDLGGIYGTAKPKSDEKHPDCPIKDWSGTWRMGWLM